MNCTVHEEIAPREEIRNNYCLNAYVPIAIFSQCWKSLHNSSLCNKSRFLASSLSDSIPGGVGTPDFK